MPKIRIERIKEHTRLLDTSIKFNESMNLFIPNANVSCYNYNTKGRLEKILKFGLHDAERKASMLKRFQMKFPTYWFCHLTKMIRLSRLIYFL